MGEVIKINSVVRKVQSVQTMQSVIKAIGNVYKINVQSGLVTINNFINNAGLRFTQNTPSTSWVITHSLGYYPNVTVKDTAGNTVEGDVAYNSLNAITISYSAPVAGIAYLS